MRTAYQLTRIGKTPMYCEVFTQPQNWAHLTQSFWLEPPRMSSGNSNCLGTDRFMPFALFTTLLGRVRLSQGNRWLSVIFILAFMLEITNKDTYFFASFSAREPHRINEGESMYPNTEFFDYGPEL